MLRPSQYRAVSLVLFGLTEAEAAEQLGVSQPTVSRYVRRAERMLPGLAFVVPVVREFHRRQHRAHLRPDACPAA
jgi:predicted transcriptional regulator